MAGPLSNIPKDGCKWSIHAAETEWGMGRATIKAKLAQSGQSPDEHGFYTTLQLLNSIVGGDIKQQKLRETRARADFIELKNAKARDQFLDARDVRQAWESVFQTMKAEILGSGNLTPEQQDSLLNHLAGYQAPKTL